MIKHIFSIEHFVIYTYIHFAMSLSKLRKERKKLLHLFNIHSSNMYT